MPKFIALIVETQCDIALYSGDPQAALHQVDVSQHPPKVDVPIAGTAAGSAHVFDGRSKLHLNQGLYIVAADHRVACSVKQGEVTIVVLGGEDPWPVPPKQLASWLPDEHEIARALANQWH